MKGQRFLNGLVCIYQRNKMYVKAAENYLIANLPIDAAKCYAEAGKTNPEFSKRSADIFEGLEQISEALKVLAEAKLEDQYVAMCFRHNDYVSLRDHLVEPVAIKACFACLDGFKVKKFLKALPLDIHTAASIARWTSVIELPELKAQALQKFSNDPNLLAHFFSESSEGLCIEIAKMLTGSQGNFSSSQLAEEIGLAQFVGKKYTSAGMIFEYLGDFLAAAKCQVHAGDLGYARDLLEGRESQRSLCQKLDSLLRSHTETPRKRHAEYPVETIEMAKDLFADIRVPSSEPRTGKLVTPSAA
jgi:hypothetical protein